MRQYFITSLLIHVISVVLFLLLSYLFTPKIYKYSLSVSLVSNANLPVNNQINKAMLKRATLEKEVIKEIPKPAPVVKSNPINTIEIPKKQPLPVLSVPKEQQEKNKTLIKDNPNFLTSSKITKQTQKKPIKEALLEKAKPEEVKISETEKKLSQEDNLVKKEKPIIIKKDQNFTNLLSSTANNNVPVIQDILSDNSPLNDSEKSNLVNQLNKCWVNLGRIKDKTLTIQLKLKMNSDATVNSIEFVEDNSLGLTKEEVDNLRVKIINLFKNPQCSKLALPNNKFALWEVFSIKLNIKGFFD